MMNLLLNLQCESLLSLALPKFVWSHKVTLLGHLMSQGQMFTLTLTLVGAAGLTDIMQRALVWMIGSFFEQTVCIKFVLDRSIKWSHLWWEACNPGWILRSDCHRSLSWLLVNISLSACLAYPLTDVGCFVPEVRSIASIAVWFPGRSSHACPSPSSSSFWLLLKSLLLLGLPVTNFWVMFFCNETGSLLLMFVEREFRFSG